MKARQHMTRIKSLMAVMETEHDVWEAKNNKSAARRARNAAMDLTRALKDYRRESVEETR